MNLQRKVQEMRVRYQPKTLQQPEEIHLHWHDLLGSARISSPGRPGECVGNVAYEHYR